MNNQEANKVSGKLLLFILILVGILAVALLTMTMPKYKYKMSTDDIHAEILKRADIIKAGECADIIFSNDSSYVFVDLRSSKDFLKGHIPGAVHIPSHRILDSDFLKKAGRKGKTIIMYDTDQSGACGPWAVLKQLGYKNIKVLAGGYDFVKENILDKYSPFSGNYLDEKAKYDFARIVNETTGIKSAAPQTSSESSSKTNIPVKKKKGGSGGC